jgi:diadenosine tetraphosphate (Ap4A) HIT family hydrolase
MIRKSIVFFILSVPPLLQGVECPFCDPQVLENQMVRRGERACVIITHCPDTEGHLLIVPVRHVERFEDLTPEEISEIGELIQKTQAAEARVFGQTDYLILQKNGRGAGQSVPHVHIHFIPKPEDMWRIGYIASILTRHWFAPLSKEETRALAERYAGYFNGLEAEARSD